MVPENIHTPTTEGIGNSRGDGGSYRICGKSGGEGEYRFLEQMENPGRQGWVLSEFPSVVGVGIFSGTSHFLNTVYMRSCSESLLQNKGNGQNYCTRTGPTFVQENWCFF